MNRRSYYSHVIVIAAFVLWMITWGTYSTFGIFLKPIVEEYGWTRAGTALAYSLSSIVQASLAIGMGALTDRIGPRFVVMVFGSFLGIAYLLMSKVTALWQFQVNYVLLVGIGLSTATVPIMVTIARWFNEKRGMMTGIVQAGMGIGGLIFSLLSGWLILKYGWQTAYLILGLITLPCTLLAGFALRRDPMEMHQGQVILSKKAYNDQQYQVSENLVVSLKAAFQTRQFWPIALIFFCIGYCRCVFLAHAAAHIQDLGYSLIDGAMVVAVLTVSSVLGRVGMGAIADVIGYRLALMISFFISSLAIMWLLMTTGLWELYLFAIVFGFGWGAQAVLRFTMAAEAFKLASLGLITGILGMAEASAVAFASYFAGYTFDVLGTYQLAFALAAGLSVIGAGITYLIRMPSKTTYTINGNI